MTKSKRRRVDGASSSSSFSSASSSDSQSASAAALATIPAGETPWIVNTDRFLFQFALDAFVLFAEEKIGAFAREILNAMLRLTDRALGDVCVLPHANRVYRLPFIFANHFDLIYMPFSLATVTQNQLFDAMYNERMNRGELGRNIEMFVELLVNDPVPFLIKTGDLGGGTYQLSMRPFCVCFCLVSFFCSPLASTPSRYRSRDYGAAAGAGRDARAGAVRGGGAAHPADSL